MPPVAAAPVTAPAPAPVAAPAGMPKVQPYTVSIDELNQVANNLRVGVSRFKV